MLVVTVKYKFLLKGICFTLRVSSKLKLTYPQIYEVAPSLFMVDVRKAAGETLEYHKVCKYIYSITVVVLFIRMQHYCVANQSCILFCGIAVLQEVMYETGKHYMESNRRNAKVRASQNNHVLIPT